MLRGRMRDTVLTASLLAVALTTGCAAAEPGPAEAALELGTGTSRFEPLVDGQEIAMVHGAQGGWHLWISARATGLDARIGSLEITQGPADGSAEPQTTRVGVTFDPPDAEGRRVTLGWQAILADPACCVGRLHRVRVTVTTASGERVSAERDVMPTAGEYPPPACGS